MKRLYHYTLNEFQDWQREHLPWYFAFQDLDAWTVVVSNGEHRVGAVFELKRSFIDVEEWKPWPEDRPNYAALVWLCKQLGIPLYVIYWVKGIPWTDSTPIAVRRMREAVPEYKCDLRLMTVGQFTIAFPTFFH